MQYFTNIHFYLVLILYITGVSELAAGSKSMANTAPGTHSQCLAVTRQTMDAESVISADVK